MVRLPSRLRPSAASRKALRRRRAASQGSTSISSGRHAVRAPDVEAVAAHREELRRAVPVHDQAPLRGSASSDTHAVWLLALDDDRPRAHEDHREGIGPEGERHQQHRRQHGAGHLRRRRHADGGALVQRVPPAHREIDDRHVDRADHRQQRAGLVGAARVVDRLDQRDVAEIQEQQDQFRGQARVPHPPGAPGRLAPAARRSTARGR